LGILKTLINPQTPSPLPPSTYTPAVAALVFFFVCFFFVFCLPSFFRASFLGFV